MPIIEFVIPPFYIQTSPSGVDVFDNTLFELSEPGTYRMRYRLGLKSNVASQHMYLILRLINEDVLMPASTQVFLVDNVNITYKDFEFIFTTSEPDEKLIIFAKVETTECAVEISYMCFNVASV